MQGDPSPAIETRGLVCGYADKAVQRDVELALPRSQVTCILGPSGCGKSTVLRTLLRLEPPLAGDVLFEGRSILSLRGRELDAWRQRIGVLFQGSALFNSMTLIENTSFPLLEKTDLSRDVAEEIARVKLDLVGLARYANYLPSRVSGGMRKRCGIARALAMDPDYLFLDEPSAGLDPITAAALDRLILEIRDTLGTTIVVVTHEVPSIEIIGDYLVMLGAERPVAVGPGEAVRAHDAPEVRTFFGREAPEIEHGSGDASLGRFMIS